MYACTYVCMYVCLCETTTTTITYCLFCVRVKEKRIIFTEGDVTWHKKKSTQAIRTYHLNNIIIRTTILFYDFLTHFIFFFFNGNLAHNINNGCPKLGTAFGHIHNLIFEKKQKYTILGAENYQKKKRHNEYYRVYPISCNSPVSIRTREKIKWKRHHFYGKKWFKSYFQI